MTTHLRSSTARIVAVAAAVSVAILSSLWINDSKDALLNTFGIDSSKGSALANNSCVVPRENNDEIYFVSCAGFF